jgi:hypothetical protein
MIGKHWTRLNKRDLAAIAAQTKAEIAAMQKAQRDYYKAKRAPYRRRPRRLAASLASS